MQKTEDKEATNKEQENNDGELDASRNGALKKNIVGDKEVRGRRRGREAPDGIRTQRNGQTKPKFVGGWAADVSMFDGGLA